MLKQGYPAYTTSCAWIGYSDQQLQQVSVLYNASVQPVYSVVGHISFFYCDSCVSLKLCTDALKSGWTKFKVKVGADLEDDKRRCRLIRKMIGPSNALVSLFLSPLSNVRLLKNGIVNIFCVR